MRRAQDHAINHGQGSMIPSGQQLDKNCALTVLPANESLSFQELQRRSNQVANLLIGSNVRRAAFLVNNRLECGELFLGAQKAGVDYIISGTDFLTRGVKLSKESLKSILDDFEADLVIISDTHKDEAIWLAPRLERAQKLVIGEPVQNWQSYEETLGKQPDTAPAHTSNGEFYPLSGGSSGRPKIIKTTRRVDGQPTEIQNLMTPDKNDIVLVCGPLYLNIYSRALTAAMLKGARVIVMEAFDPLSLLRVISDYKVTRLTLPPGAMIELLNVPGRQQKRYDVSSIKRLIHTGGPCPENIKRQFIEWFGENIVEVYAMTERFGGTAITVRDWLAHPGSVGKAFPGCHITIRDEKSHPLEPYQKGVIWFSHDAECTRMEYLGNQTASQDCYNQYGEATVNDVGHLDKDGFLYLTGRLHRMFNVRGINVYPEPTENLLIGQPEVADAWAFAVQDEKTGERLGVFVQLKPASRASKKRLTNLCRDNLGEFATPVKIVYVENLPRNEAGKMNAEEIVKLEAKFR
jgi:long-chain acyl-CoA synthetase